VFGFVVAVAVLILVSSGLPAETGGSKPVAGIIKLLLGGALLFLASRQWRSGRAAAGEPKLPKWMSAIDTMTPVRRLVPGFLLSAVDPKNLLLGASAGVSVGAAQLDFASTVVVTVVFNVVAAVTPAAASQRNDAARALRRFFTELRLAR
jgi:threonine/homoserine/homoserine lactone efflux protein